MDDKNKLALISAYYLSKYNHEALRALGYSAYSQAFNDIGDRLGVKANSVKNMRDEFDPIHDNDRVGWYQRPLRPSRARVAQLFSGVSFELGYTRGLLYKHLPDLHRKIRDRYQDFKQAECKRRHIQLQEEVREACLKLYRQGVYLTAPSVANFLDKPTYKVRRDVRAIILETRRQLGQSRK